MKTISLTQGKFALVDDADYAAVSAFKWHAHTTGPNHTFYACRNIPTGRGSQTILKLHHFLLPGVKRVDHRDGDGLNCQRRNLRPATHGQNMRAVRRKTPGKTSEFRGVSWFKQRGKWMARIQVAGKDLYLGLFGIESAAAKAYDRAALQHFGEFAAPNFPRPIGQ